MSMAPARAARQCGAGKDWAPTRVPSIRDVTKVNVYFIGVLFVVLMLVTYVPIIPLAPIDLFYR
jgi:hypothetical protein